jgi:hypothetical protein
VSTSHYGKLQRGVWQNGKFAKVHIWSIDGPREIELERDIDGLRESQSRSLHGGSSLKSAEGSHSGAELVLADTFE